MQNRYFRFECKCGLENYNKEDWLAHWKHGIKRPPVFLGNHPKLRAIYLFLTTKIKLGA